MKKKIVDVVTSDKIKTCEAKAYCSVCGRLRPVAEFEDKTCQDCRKSLTYFGGISGPKFLYSVSHYKGQTVDNRMFFRFVFYVNSKRHHETTSADLGALHFEEEKFLSSVRSAAADDSGFKNRIILGGL